MILNCPRKCKSQKLSKNVCCSIEREWNPCHTQIFPQRKLEVLTDALTRRVYQTSCKPNSHVTRTVKETPCPSSFLNMTPWKIPVGKQLADCFYHQNKCPTPKHCNIWEVWVSVTGPVDAKETRVPVSEQRTAETCWQPVLSMHLGGCGRGTDFQTLRHIESSDLETPEALVGLSSSVLLCVFISVWTRPSQK